LPEEFHSADEWLGVFSEMLVSTADDLAQKIAAKPGRAQDAAYWEFVYALMFVTIQQLGHHLATQQQLPVEAQQELIAAVHKRLLGESIEHRSPNREDDAFDRAFLVHAEAAELRADYYFPMPVFVRGNEGLAGKLVWEAPKQAIRSALGDPEKNLAVLLSASATFPMLLLGLQIPTFVLQFANAATRESQAS